MSRRSAPSTSPTTWAADEDLAPAILDRVFERGRLVRLDGPSVRTLQVDLDEAMEDESNHEDDR